MRHHAATTCVTASFYFMDNLLEMLDTIAYAASNIRSKAISIGISYEVMRCIERDVSEIVPSFAWWIPQTPLDSININRYGVLFHFYILEACPFNPSPLHYILYKGINDLYRDRLPLSYVLQKKYENPFGTISAGTQKTFDEWVKVFPQLTRSDIETKTDWFLKKVTL
jgi:hypothetical protein